MPDRWWDVLEGLDGRLAVQYEGRIVASQEAPPRPSILRSFDTQDRATRLAPAATTPTESAQYRRMRWR